MLATVSLTAFAANEMAAAHLTVCNTIPFTWLLSMVQCSADAFFFLTFR